MIQPSRELRQGDPLSPFLFLFCTNGLHGLIKKAAGAGDIRGFSLCKRGPKLTHLFFANNSLLFFTAIPEECNKVLKILFDYEALSGQKINKETTTLFFSKLTQMHQEILSRECLEYKKSSSMRNTSTSLLL